MSAAPSLARASSRASSRMLQRGFSRRADVGGECMVPTMTTQTTQVSLPSLVAEVEEKGRSSLEKVRASELNRHGCFSRHCRRIVESESFKHGLSAVILLNVVELGTSTDFRAEPWEGVWWVMDNFFVAFFLAEMVLKMAAYYPRGYFSVRANIFDFALVWVGVIDLWFLLLMDDEEGNASFERFGVLRVFRLLRLLRMMKVLSIQRQLVVVIEGIAASLSSMFWIGLLLAVIIYTFAIFCVVVIGRAEGGHPSKEQLFGNIPRSMLSLFNITLLTEWPTIVWPLFDQQPYVVPFFVVFVVFASCGVLNVIIGVIVERTNQAGHKMREDDIKLHRLRQMEMAKTLAMLVKELDADGDERLSFTELLHGMEASALPVLLQGLELPCGFTLRHLFMILDENSDDRLSHKEFVVGMRQLITSNEFQRHCVVQLCLAQIKREVKRVQRQVAREVHASNSQIMGELEKLQRHLGMAPQPPEPYERRGSQVSARSLRSDMEQGPMLGPSTTEEQEKEWDKVSAGSGMKAGKDSARSTSASPRHSPAFQPSTFGKSVALAVRHAVAAAEAAPAKVQRLSRRATVQSKQKEHNGSVEAAHNTPGVSPVLAPLVLTSEAAHPSAASERVWTPDLDKEKEFNDMIIDVSEKPSSSPLHECLANGRLGPGNSKEPTPSSGGRHGPPRTGRSP